LKYAVRNKRDKVLKAEDFRFMERFVGKKRTKQQSDRSALQRLREELIGLEQVKDQVEETVQVLKFNRMREKFGIKTSGYHNVHLMLGAPGTAKTTVARLFARIMRENRLLSKGQLIEVGRCDLVGKYVGWTAPIIKDKFKAASGGVLFVDEAYSLVDDRDGSYGDEAINTIVQEMENHRADVVVIFAGYPDEMEKFLQKNPGLRSRIAFHVPFEDYDADELCKIAALIGKNKGISLEDAALQKLGTIFETARKQSDFGNGRYVRNVLEQAKMNQASRLLEYDFDDITTEEITTIKAVDIVIPEIKIESKPKIGFAC
jgi:SpoVK/Ycf46/Vps4 family AAA+-type ATPase